MMRAASPGPSLREVRDHPQDRGRPRHVRRAHGEAVHRGVVERGDPAVGAHVLGEDPPHRGRQRDPLRPERSHGRLDLRAGGREGDVDPFGLHRRPRRLAHRIPHG
jgi:hypothetical protein